jgi:methyl-accepting chemotaxis protein
MKLFPSTIGGRLVLGYAATAFFMAAVIGLAWYELSLLGRASRHLTDDLAARERQARQWQAVLGRDALAASSMLVTSDPDKLKPLIAELKADAKRIADIYAAFAAAPTESDAASVVPKAHERHANATRDFLQAVDSGSSDFAKSEFYDKYVPALREYEAALEQLAQAQQQEMDTGRSAATLAMERGIRLMLVIGLAAAAASMLLAWRLSREIRHGLAEAVRVTHAVADGDLSARASITSQGELQQLLAAQELMAERLRETMTRIQTSAETVRVAAHEMAGASNDLSVRTEHQAATLQQTSSAMERFTASLRGNANTAAEASRLAASASESAVLRGREMSVLVSTMNEMATSSGEIAEITSVIDSIAFQTNILALNAGVEAARAGDHGRGFAVVADEVRTLAKRSASAAQQIRTLIQQSIERVETGARLATAAGQSIGTLVQSVQSVSGMLQEVTASGAEQSREITSVVQSVSTLDGMTQQNAAMVEQGAAASSSLTAQADALKNATAVFRFA